MSNVVDFRSRRSDEGKPTREADDVLYIWRDAQGDVDWTCFASEVGHKDRAALLHSAMFCQLAKEDEEGHHLIFLSYLDSSGGAAREIDRRAFTNTGWRHAWWLWKNAWRNWWFLSRYAWIAWRRPLKSNPVLPAE